MGASKRLGRLQLSGEIEDGAKSFGDAMSNRKGEITMSSDEVLEALCLARDAEKAIDYGKLSDKEYAEITWQRWGLPELNQIVVTAEVGELCLATAAITRLAWPAMIDRTFGIDLDDADLAMRLSERLWSAESERLVAEALRVRMAIGGSPD